MFQLSQSEFEALISQIAISKRGGTRKLPYAFTEHGILMLSSVLNSERAIQINIQIMRAFTRMRQILADNQEVKKKIEELDEKYNKYLTKHGSLLIFHDKIIKGLLKDFSEINKLLTPPREPQQEKIGFKAK